MRLGLKFARELDQFHVIIDADYCQLKGLERKLRFIVFTLFNPFLEILGIFRKSHRDFSLVADRIRARKILLVESVNNYAALAFLANSYDLTVVLRDDLKSLNVVDPIVLSTFLRPQFSFRKYAFLLYLFFSKRFGSNNFATVSKYFDSYEQLSFLVKDECRPKCVFTANDHNPVSRAVIQLCMNYGVPCFYFQHASVTRRFPPLLFEASFLYGKFSLAAYKSAGPIVGHVHLVGNHKFDSYRNVIAMKRERGSNKIGVCTNLLDSVAVLRDLVSYLREYLPDKAVYLRPHPRQSISEFDPFREAFNISNSVVERSEEFLSDMDVVIADNSSILLEAACMECLPIQVPLSAGGGGDYYSFVEEGVVCYCENFEQVILAINRHYKLRGEYRCRASTFDASVGAPFEFQVERKIIALLTDRYGLAVDKK